MHLAHVLFTMRGRAVFFFFKEFAPMLLQQPGADAIPPPLRAICEFAAHDLTTAVELKTAALELETAARTILCLTSAQILWPMCIHSWGNSNPRSATTLAG